MKFFLLLFGLCLITHAEVLRINQIQVIGTHNSYHIGPGSQARALIGIFSQKEARALDYSHQPLDQQLDSGIRQFELDLFADPVGGRFAPTGALPNDPMMQAGTKVLHVPGIDSRSTHPTFIDALNAIHRWSAVHPRHVPIMILLELKDSQDHPLIEQPIPFDRPTIFALEEEVLTIFNRNQIITPDLVRGSYESLRQSVLTTGWPTLDSSLGKVMFCLDNEGSHRTAYLAGNPTLKNRLFFVSVPRSHSAAAWMKINDPVRSCSQIQDLVREGFMVRTRADADTAEARKNDTTRRDLAFASGAQFISTDYPKPNLRFSSYAVTLPNNAEYQINPVTWSEH